MTAPAAGDIYSTMVGAAVALAAGFLIGFEREWTQALEKRRHAFAGARTFTLTCFAGALCEMAGGALLVAAGLLVIGGLTIFAYSFSARADEGRGGTTEIALVAAFLLGAAAGRGDTLLAAGGAVAITVALSLKGEIRRLARALDEKELHASIRFLAIAVLILPVTPDRDFGPYGALNPRDLWFMVVLISGLSFAGYWLVKALGAAHGVIAAGLVGGLASSTATTLSLARMTREGTAAPLAAAAGIVMANVVMLVRIAIVLAAAAPALLARIAVPLGAGAAAGSAIAFALWRLSAKESVSRGEVVVGNPFELRPAVIFAALLAAVSLASAVAADRMGEAALYAVAFVSGLADVDAMTLSAARGQSAGAIAMSAASGAILVAVGANFLSKGAMAVAAGKARAAAPVVAAFAAMALAGAAAIHFG
jgi:uncharacterized membrane protein (DUF4010 family)